MAEENSFSSLDFGIQDTAVVGNAQLLEDFLSETSTVKTDPADISKIDPNKEKLKDDAAKKVEKKEEEKQHSQNDLLKGAFGDEEETGEKETKDEDKEKEKDDATPDETNTFEALSKELYRLGTFTLDEGETEEAPKTGQEFKELFEKQNQKGATRWLDSFLRSEGDDRIDLFQAIFIDKVDPREYFSTYNEVLDLQEMDLTNVDNQRSVYKEYFRRQGMDEAKIKTRLERAEDRGDLEEESKDFHEALVKQDVASLEQQKQQSAKASALKQKLDVEYKSSIAKILTEKAKTKEINGIPLSDQLKQQAFDFLYTQKWQTPDGEKLTDFDKFILDTRRPENHEKRIMIALLALNNFDLSKVEKQAVSKESSELFNELNRKKKQEKTATKTNSTSAHSWLQL